MKRLAYEGFHDRVEALLRARKIFIPHITKNISIAFEIYQELLAEQERDLYLESERQYMYSIISGYIRPLCPDCNSELYLRVIYPEEGPSNTQGYQSCWICIKDDCIYEKYSMETMSQIIKTLKKKPEEVPNG